MNRIYRIAFFFWCLFTPILGISQVEEPREDDLGDVSDTFQDKFFEGLKQAAIENHEKAIAAFSDCAAENPNSAIIQYELGKAYLKTEDYVLAESALKKAVALENDNEWYLDALYQVYDKTNQEDNIIDTLNKLVKYHSDYKLDLVKFYYEKKNYKKALELLDQLDVEVGRDKDRDYLRKIIYSRSDNSASKIAFYNQRIMQYPTEEDNYLQLIIEYSNQKNTKKAFDVAERLLKQNPNSDNVHLGLYKFYLDGGQEQLAINSMNKVVLSQTVDVISKQKVLTDFLRFVKDKDGYEDTVNDLAAELEKIPNSERLLKVIANYYQNKNQGDKAIKYLTSASEANMNDFGSLRSYLLALSEAKDYDKVLSKTNEALELYPSQPILYLLNGTALNYKNKPNEAIESLESGLDYIIDDAIMESDMYYQIAQAYRTKGDDANYKKYLQKAKKVLENAN